MSQLQLHFSAEAGTNFLKAAVYNKHVLLRLKVNYFSIKIHNARSNVKSMHFICAVNEVMLYVTGICPYLKCVGL